MKWTAERTLLGAGEAVPAAAYGICYFASRRFRTAVHQMNPRWPTLLQTARLVGAGLFAWQYANGRMVGTHAVTTAFCDFAAGISAPFAARFATRDGLKLWNLFGLTLILLSGGSGLLASPTGPVCRFGKDRQPGTEFPGVLVPTVFGPVTLLAHLVALTATTGRRAPEP